MDVSQSFLSKCRAHVQLRAVLLSAAFQITLRVPNLTAVLKNQRWKKLIWRPVSSLDTCTVRFVSL